MLGNCQVRQPPACPTWAELVEVEPALCELESEAAGVAADDWPAWERVKGRLCRLVGFELAVRADKAVIHRKNLESVYFGFVYKGRTKLNVRGAYNKSLGACSGKTCPEYIVKLFKAEGLDVDQVAPPTLRPLFLEVPFGVFSAGSRAAEDPE